MSRPRDGAPVLAEARTQGSDVSERPRQRHLTKNAVSIIVAFIALAGTIVTEFAHIVTAGTNHDPGSVTNQCNQCNQYNQQPSPGSMAPVLHIRMQNVSGSTGSSAGFPGVSWISSVTLGGESVRQGCTASWMMLRDGVLSADGSGACISRFSTGSALTDGHYEIVEVAVLKSGATATMSTNFTVRS